MSHIGKLVSALKRLLGVEVPRIKHFFSPALGNAQPKTAADIEVYNARLAGADFLYEPMLSLRNRENFDKLIEHPDFKCAQCERNAIWFANMRYPRCRYHLAEDAYE